MGIETEIKSRQLKYSVENLLAAYPITRDCDTMLWLAYATTCHDLKNKLGEAAYNTLKQALLNDLPSFESITRVRRKIQEQRPELRGKNAAKRKASAEVVREWSQQDEL